jgi:triosephosphate isomerase
VNQKIKTALKQKFKVILCIGERDRDKHGHYLQFITDQLKESLDKVSSKEMQSILIAYEPVWAIGKTGDDAITPEKLHETILFIRKVLVGIYNKRLAMDATVIYGGSVEPMNAEELLVSGHAEGFLVGHASLNASTFNDILTTANVYKP